MNTNNIISVMIIVLFLYIVIAFIHLDHTNRVKSEEFYKKYPIGSEVTSEYITNRMIVVRVNHHRNIEHVTLSVRASGGGTNFLMTVPISIID